jgi:hypothetical protein
VAGDNQNLLGNISSIKSLTSGIARTRRRVGVVLDHAKNHMCEETRLTLCIEKFLLYDVDNKACGRLLIYSAFTNLIHLANTKVWVGDGTFYSCPCVFSQLYTIQGLVRGRFYPLVFILMEKMSIKAHEYAFDLLSICVVGNLRLLFLIL